MIMRPARFLGVSWGKGWMLSLRFATKRKKRVGFVTGQRKGKLSGDLVSFQANRNPSEGCGLISDPTRRRQRAFLFNLEPMLSVRWFIGGAHVVPL